VTCDVRLALVDGNTASPCANSQMLVIYDKSAPPKVTSTPWGIWAIVSIVVVAVLLAALVVVGLLLVRYYRAAKGPGSQSATAYAFMTAGSSS
jgi:hypothetical protein